MHSKLPVAVHVFFLRKNEILLARRYNTGYEDGNYSVVAGHLEAGETVTEAAIREAREEAGLTLRPADLQIIGVMHRRARDERIDFSWPQPPGKANPRIWSRINAAKLAGSRLRRYQATWFLTSGRPLPIILRAGGFRSTGGPEIFNKCVLTHSWLVSYPLK